jgi:hypothetical protein
MFRRLKGFRRIGTRNDKVMFSVYIYRSGCMRRFASPNKGLRSKTRAGKMWVE